MCPRGFCRTKRLTIRLAIRTEWLRRGVAGAAWVSVFNVVARGAERAMFDIDMDENNNSSAANLGVFVVISVVPIVAYVVAVLVLPWVGRGFH
jgi:hypothetical protein